MNNKPHEIKKAYFASYDPKTGKVTRIADAASARIDFLDDTPQEPIHLTDLDFTFTMTIKNEHLFWWFMALHYWHRYRVSMN